MHASVEQLLSLRDGEPVPQAAAEHVAGCAECSAELERLEEMKAALAALPQEEPPAGVWAAVVERAAAPRRNRRLSSWWWAGAGMAASVLAVAMALMTGDAESPEVPTVASTEAPAAAVPDTSALVERSRRLEATLRAMSPEPQVVNAGTASTIAALEDNLAFVDYQLTLAATDPVPPEQAYELWEARVALMDSLVNVRYAQLRRADY